MHRPLFLLLICVLLSGCGDLLHPIKMLAAGAREPKPLEQQYHSLAREIASPKPCLLVSSSAISFSAWGGPGARYIRIRSDCYLEVALKTQNIHLCDQIENIPVWMERDSLLGPHYCRQLVEQRNRGIGEMPDLSLLMSEMGYADDEIEQASGNPRRTMRSEEFFYRIDRLPHYGSEEDRRQMQAMVWQPPAQHPPQPDVCGPHEQPPGDGEPPRICIPFPG
ncbi:MAG: hypothetical protein M0Q42_12300 [Xanthomonadales bacterium]|nr:hypothetical protein [Xanthomonadales bacterium]